MSLQIKISDTGDRLASHRLGDLCGYLDRRVVGPHLARHGVRWEARFEQFFLHQPGCDPFAATGTIEFYPPPLLLGQLDGLEAAIREALQALGIRTDRCERLHYAESQAVKVIRIPIVENPAARNDPPEVNMSTSAGRLVLRDLLGYQATDGRYRFSAEDMLHRMEALGDAQIEACSVSPSRLAKGNESRRVRRVPSPMTLKRIRRCLGELRDYADWASRNRFQQLEVGSAPRN
jgi:hypothetical protein